MLFCGLWVVHDLLSLPLEFASLVLKRSNSIILWVGGRWQGAVCKWIRLVGRIT